MKTRLQSCSLGKVQHNVRRRGQCPQDGSCTYKMLLFCINYFSSSNKSVGAESRKYDGQLSTFTGLSAEDDVAIMAPFLRICYHEEQTT